MTTRFARVAAAFVAIAFSAVGCATMLELDDYDSAIELVCECPGFENVTDCVSTAQKRLNFASDADQRAWLADYQAKQCGVVCDRAVECYSSVPGCQEKRVGCECCVWKNGKLDCELNQCETCSTCFDQATSQSVNTACATGRVLFGDLQRCACDACPDECTNFCQGTAVLPPTGANNCATCLESQCKLAFDACFADKP